MINCRHCYLKPAGVNAATYTTLRRNQETGNFWGRHEVIKLKFREVWDFWRMFPKILNDMLNFRYDFYSHAVPVKPCLSDLSDPVYLRMFLLGILRKCFEILTEIQQTAVRNTNFIFTLTFTNFVRILRLRPQNVLYKQQNKCNSRGVTSVNFCWVCAAGISEPLSH